MTSRRFVRDILPVLCWLGVIFFLSTDHGSAEHTNSFLDRYVRLWFGAFMAHLNPNQLELLHYCVRKAAHLTIYFVLAVLSMRALRRTRRFGRIARAAAFAWVFATVYAMTDEFHQRFVSSRTPKVTDVLIDSCGAFIGVALTAAICRFRDKKRSRQVTASAMSATT